MAEIPYELQAGDVLLFKRAKSRSIIPKLIRLIQGNKYVHVALCIKAGPDPLFAEIDSDFTLRICDWQILTRKDVPDVARMKDTWLSTLKPNSLIVQAYTMQGQKYGFHKILDACINHVLDNLYSIFDKPYKYKRHYDNGELQVCSTLTSLLLSKASDLGYNEFAEPDDFCVHPFQVVHTL